jgi:hypothetical protein
MLLRKLATYMKFFRIQSVKRRQGIRADDCRTDDRISGSQASRNGQTRYKIEVRKEQKEKA